MRLALLVTLGVTVGGAGLPKHDLRAWIKENKPAIDSPPLLARLRRGR